jgi:tRNA threonylcarbamoyladenosine biosynthesis protein TsaE
MLYYRQADIIIMDSYIFLSNSPASTSALGKKIGENLEAGSIVALIGELGCGKTLLTRGICAGLGVPLRQVNSPTFVLVNEYQGRLPVFHMDLYRLDGAADGVDIGLVDYLARAESGVIVVEWAEKIFNLLSDNYLKVVFKIISARKRRIELSAPGTGFSSLFRELGKK